MNMMLELKSPVARSGAPKRTIAAPSSPDSIAETGLCESFLLSLLMKQIYRLGLEWPHQMTAALHLPLHITQHLISCALDFRLIEPLGQAEAQYRSEMRYGITGKGREWALEALERSQWAGPAPVPLDQYARQMKAQTLRGEVLSAAMLNRVFKNLTLAPQLMDEIGPAVNSGTSLLLYGPPGNGKSSIAEAVCEAYCDHIYVPHAIEVDQQIITVYDPTVHERVDETETGPASLRRPSDRDRRFVRCRRPVVVTGGELELAMLDLAYSSSSSVYEAPIQLKASGGVFVVDDLGRQRHTPQQLVNRLIVPLEKAADYLSLQTGRKFEIPFDTLVIFSTNLPPSELADGAALRRLRYKILVDKPEPDVFVQIFRQAADRADLHLDDDILRFILHEMYPSEPGAEMHAFHPRFLIDQVKSICIYEGVEPMFTKPYLRRAWRNLFPKH